MQVSDTMNQLKKDACYQGLVVDANVLVFLSHYGAQVATFSNGHHDPKFLSCSKTSIKWQHILMADFGHNMKFILLVRHDLGVGALSIHVNYFDGDVFSLFW